MLRTRIIPSLLLRNESLVKTVKFSKFTYVGDPCNTVRIFNELEVDELFLLDISATPLGGGPNLELLAEIANECFMPLGYGGGIQTLEQARDVFKIGFEKVVLNTHAVRKPELIEQISSVYGSQATIVSIDVRKTFYGKDRVAINGGRIKTSLDPVAWAQEVAKRGAGEILLTSIDCEGSWQGMDYDLISKVSSAVDIPVVAQGGVGNIDHISRAVRDGGASAVAVGSMVVFQKKGMGVLINFPDKEDVDRALGN